MCVCECVVHAALNNLRYDNGGLDSKRYVFSKIKIAVELVIMRFD